MNSEEDRPWVSLMGNKPIDPTKEGSNVKLLATQNNEEMRK